MRLAISGANKVELADEEELHQFETDSVKAGLEFMKSYVLSLDNHTRDEYEFYLLREAPPIQVVPPKSGEKVRITLDDLNRISGVKAPTHKRSSEEIQLIFERHGENILEDYDFGDTMSAIKERYKVPQGQLRSFLVDNNRPIRKGRKKKNG